MLLADHMAILHAEGWIPEACPMFVCLSWYIALENYIFLFDKMNVFIQAV